MSRPRWPWISPNDMFMACTSTWTFLWGKVHPFYQPSEDFSKSWEISPKTFKWLGDVQCTTYFSILSYVLIKTSHKVQCNKKSSLWEQWSILVVQSSAHFNLASIIRRFTSAPAWSSFWLLNLQCSFSMYFICLLSWIVWWLKTKTAEPNWLGRFKSWLISF